MFPKIIQTFRVLAWFLAVRTSTDPTSEGQDSVFSPFMSIQVAQRGNSSYPSAAFYVAYEWLLMAQQMVSGGFSYRTFP